MPPDRRPGDTQSAHDAAAPTFPSTLRGWLGFSILGLLGLLMIHHPMLLSGLARVQTDDSDTRLLNYLLEHNFRWILQEPGHRQFWEIPIFYPARNVAAYSDTLLSVAPLYWVFRLARAMPDTAFQLWMLTVSACNYIAGFWLFRSGFRRSVLGSALAAFLFAFSAARANEVEHQQLLPQVYTVFALWALCRIFAQPPDLRSTSYLLWSTASLSLAAQFYAAFYLGWFLSLAVAITAFCGLFQARTRAAFFGVIRSQWPAMAVALALALVAIAPLLTHYLQAVQEAGTRADTEIMISIPFARTLIYMGPENWVWGFSWKWSIFDDMGRNLERAQRRGIGFVTLAVCLAGLVRSRHEPGVRIAGLSGLGLLVLVTRFSRELWLGLTVGVFAVCLLELWRANNSVQERRTLGLLTLCAGATCFPVITLAWALILASAVWGSRIFLSARTWSHFARPLPAVLIAFLAWTAYSHQFVALVAAAVVLALAEAWRMAGGSRLSLRTISGATTILVVGCWIFPLDIIGWRYGRWFLPGGHVIRAVSRGLLLGLVPAGLGLACFFEQPWGTRKRAVAACGLALVCLLEQGVTTTSFDKYQNRSQVADLARRIDRDFACFYYSTDDGERAINLYHLDAMWAQMETGIPTVNGYSGARPPAWLPLYAAAVTGEGDRARLEPALAHWAALHQMDRQEIFWLIDADDRKTSRRRAGDRAGTSQQAR
jgi:hypothetical protein